MEGIITAVCTSATKGVPKDDVGTAILVGGHGFQGDAHAGDWHRQVSLLSEESIGKMRAKGIDAYAGLFAENITTRGIDLPNLKVGTRLKAGPEALLEVTQIGKQCHVGCAIFQQVGDCIMPKEGIFAKVLKGGSVSKGDAIFEVPRIDIGVLTVSDKGSKGEREDLSGPAIEEALSGIGLVVDKRMVPDEREQISEALISICDAGSVNLVLTTGGTGFSPRDVTPEATLSVLEKLAPGIPEAIRAAGMAKTDRSMLSRATAGIRGRTLIINLPGSPRAVKECLEVVLPVLPHAISILCGIESECARK